jgi:hypothetical protein
MLKISRDDRKLTPVESVTLTDAGIFEKYDLELWLSNSFEEFCHEINQPLQLLGKDVRPSAKVGDIIDLLALDEDGNAVIIELKKGSNKLQLLQAIAYASMISEWELADFQKTAGWTDVEDFLQVEQEEVNREQRIILVAEEYRYEVLASAEWLLGKVDVACFRVEMFRDTKATPESEYLAFTQVYPIRGLDEIAVGTNSQGQGPGATPLYPEFLAIINAYNASAPPGLAANGNAPGFRVIHPADWPFKKFLFYNINRKGDGFTSALYVHKDAPPGFLELAKTFDGKTLADGTKLLWEDMEGTRAKGRLIARFPLTTPPETVAKAVHELIATTRPKVNEKRQGSLKPPTAAG